MDNFPESKRELGLDYEPVWCGHCNGSGRMVRDPDIGTDQECFVCDGAGVPAAPVQEPVVQNICIECANADSWGLPDKPACQSCVSNSEWKPLNVSSKNPATPPVQEPAEVLGHNGWGFPIKAAAPVQEDWGPGPHECHSLTEASVQKPDEWLTGCPECGMDSGCDCDSGTWNPPAAPVQEPVWIRPDELQKAQKAPFLCRVGPNKRDDFVPLYPAPPAAQRQWVGLTDDELKAVTRLEGANSRAQLDLGKAFWAGARWAEAQLKEKNT